MSNVYFNQLDQRWANKMYSSVNNSAQTIGTSGCGPTSGAMVVSSLTASIVYPDVMAEYYVQNGYRSASNGTYWSAFKGTADKYGIEFKQTSDISVAIDCISKGGKVVASTPGGSTGLFSTNGHFVVLVGLANNTFTVYDSYLYKGKYDLSFRKGKASVSGNNVYVSVDITKSEIQQYFCFYPQNEIVTTGKYVNVNTALNVRSGPGTNYSVLTTLSNNTLVTVYEQSDIWCRIGDGKWVSGEYLSDAPSTVIVNKVMTVNAKTGLNVRETPSTNGRIVTAYPYGTRVTVYEIKDGWARGVKGWMYAQYLV